MYLPRRINILLLSATIGNGEQIINWLKALRDKDCTLISSDKRPTPLYPLFYHPRRRLLTPLLDNEGNIFAEAKEYCQSKQKYPRPLGVAPLLAMLRRYNLLPAIFFVKSFMFQ
jgi:superfamily II RNA helicase